MVVVFFFSLIELTISIVHFDMEIDITEDFGRAEDFRKVQINQNRVVIFNPRATEIWVGQAHPSLVAPFY